MTLPGTSPTAGTSVVVVAQRAGQWLERCIASLQPQAEQIVVVDNGSDANEVTAAGRRAGTAVVTNDRNRGFAGGVNSGLAMVTGDVVALLNDDATADPTWLSGAVEVLRDPSVAAVGPKVLLEQPYAEVRLDSEPWFAPGDARPLGRRLTSVQCGGSDVLSALVGPGVHGLERQGADRWRWTRGSGPIFVPLDEAHSPVVVDGEEVETRAVHRLVNSAGVYLRPDGAAGDYGFGAVDDGRFDVDGERFGLSGVALVTRADTLARLGGLAEPFFAYYEDVDWCWRMRLAGLRLVYDPTSTVTHRRSLTSGGTDNPRVRFLGERNRLLAVARNAPAPVARGLMTKAWREQNQPGIRAGLGRLLPWALWSRATTLRSTRRCSAKEVWQRWAGADLSWGTGEGTEW